MGNALRLLARNRSHTQNGHVWPRGEKTLLGKQNTSFAPH